MIDNPISQKLLLPYLNHAVSMLESGYATRADIDAAMRYGCGYPAGPLEMLDQIGASRVNDLLAERFAQSGDNLHQPTALLGKLAAGEDAGSGDTDNAAAPQFRRPINTVGVVGTGTMATGIVEVFAKAGYPVTYVGRGEDKVAGVRASIEKSLAKAVERGKLDEAGRDAVLANLTGATSREALGDVDIVVEAIAEDLEIKKQLFADLDRICKPGAILATTTSSLPITVCAESTSRPADVIGMHFFNPAPIMKLVEVVTTEQTSADVDETVKALCDKTGKVAVSCGDRAGFIVNCLLFPYLNDAVRMVDAGEASIDEIDAAIKENVKLPMGPFALLDVVGNDVSLAIQKELYSEFGHAGFAPAAGLEKVVAAGHLGRKTKQGFHDYN
ncbi:MAG TPA: 3-hydroxyacyl-CoA dehydrogenase NAD-binding domain-containing protein [Marmoricola sp.]|nr:3-hydroxyacyl-CoA dehydrogenase NAD-binding domain-containing protein [Marmoricola sp.]HNJ77977.1 3-hydroxyacyl-CoA dehydrogenase NAD-binding domain-containing protein [Marmoricola sp.]HNN47511.1 3-hydroxyacyl-CoA dehydrogenase NAD-binding domain-containing protein [Marmoricola sp.]